MLTTKKAVFIGLTMCLLQSCDHSQVNHQQHDSHQTTIIAHRGASGYLPEHTKEAAVMAYMQGADFIEQDLVVTKDDQLVVLHDIHLASVTNVEQRFPERIREDGQYYAVDFTLAELRELSLHERQNADNTQVFSGRYSGIAHFSISTFAEQVELIRELNRQLGKNVGWYPEIKSPEWHLSEGKDIAKLLVDELERLNLNSSQSRIYVQSFEPNSLRYMREQLNLKVNLIQLIGENSWGESSVNYDAMKTQEGLKEIAQYADGIGPWLPQIYDLASGDVTDLFLQAKQQGLLIHAYTHREDVESASTSARQRFNTLQKAGIDGIFTDQVMPYMLEK